MKAFGCVGTHGKLFVCVSSHDLRLCGRLEIYETFKDARRNALSDDHVREVSIILHRKKKK